MGRRAVAAAIALLLLPAPGVAAAYARQDRIVICSATGMREIVLGPDGKPMPAPRREASGCAHLWCEPRRGRPPGWRCAAV